MDTYYLVMRSDLSVVSGKRETESEAWDLADELCKKSGKSFIVAQVLGISQVERFPVKRVYAGDGNDNPQA